MSILSPAALSPNDPMILRRTPADGGPPLGENEMAPLPAGAISFDDVLDGLNPLQHLPGVGTIYRAVTGDTIQPALRVAGAAILGGPIGMILAALGSLAEEIVARGPAEGAVRAAEMARQDRSLVG